MKQMLFIISCIILFGISTFFRKLAMDRMHPFQFQIIAGVIYMITIPIWIWIWMSSNKSSMQYNISGILFATICIALYTVGVVLFGFLLKNSNNTGIVASMLSLNPIITLALSYLFLGEVLTTAKVVAFVLAMTSAILINY